MYLNWKDEYTTGIEQIDDEHKKIFSYYNKLVTSIDEGLNNASLDELFYFLIEYIKYHIKSEEEFQEKMKYPDRDKHKEYHLEFRSTLRDYLYKYINNSISTQDIKAIGFFLEDWLVNHIIKEDIRIMRKIK